MNREMKAKKKNIHATFFTTIQQHNLNATCFPSLLNGDPVAYTCQQKKRESVIYIQHLYSSQGSPYIMWK